MAEVLVPGRLPIRPPLSPTHLLLLSTHVGLYKQTVQAILCKLGHLVVKQFKEAIIQVTISSQKTHFDDEVMVSNLSSGVYKFQLTVTDSIGQSDSAQVTVLVLTLEQSNRKSTVL